MAYTPTVFSQLLAMISRERFQSIVERYKGDFHVRTYSCWSHLVVMIFAQVTDKESLRDLETALLSKKIPLSSWRVASAALNDLACQLDTQLENLSRRVS